MPHLPSLLSTAVVVAPLLRSKVTAWLMVRHCACIFLAVVLTRSA